MLHGQSKAYTYPRDTKTLGCQHGDPNGIIAKTTFGIRSEDRRGSKSEANPLGHREDQITYMGTQLEENEQQLIIQVLNVNVDLFM